MFDQLDGYDTNRPTSFMPDIVALIGSPFNSYITTYLTVYIRIQNPADPNHSKFHGSSLVTYELALTQGIESEARTQADVVHDALRDHNVLSSLASAPSPGADHVTICRLSRLLLGLLSSRSLGILRLCFILLRSPTALLLAVSSLIILLLFFLLLLFLLFLLRTLLLFLTCGSCTSRLLATLSHILTLIVLLKATFFFVCLLFLLVFFLGLSFLAVIFFLIGATTGLLLNVQLRGFLDNIIAAAFDVNGWVAGFGVLLDLVAAFGGDCDFTFFLLLGYFAAGSTTTPGP